MSIVLSNPRLSFINFSDAPPPDMPLPIAAGSDIAFQVLLTAADEAEADTIGNDTLKLSIWSMPESELLHDYYADGYYFTFYRLSATQVLAYWTNGLPDVDTYAPFDSCFTIVLLVVGTYTFIYNSVLLKHVFDNKYTSIIEYSCEENSYGFNYCADHTPNRVRVPMYLWKPQFVDEEEVYFKSDGSVKVLKSVTRKTFELTVDHLDAATHEKIKVALSHDAVFIESDVYSGGIRKNGSYDIEWYDKPGYSEVSPAKTKVYATPYLVRNDNCAVCESFTPPPPPEGNLLWTFTEGDDVQGYLMVSENGTSVVSTFENLSNTIAVAVGSTINVNVGLETSTTDYSNMTVYKDGSIIHNAPEYPGSVGNAFSFVVEEGASYEIVSSTSAGAVCEPIVVDFMPVPDGFVDVPYEVLMPITAGTAPFDIIVYEVPLWMTVEVVNVSGTNYIRLFGTPSGTVYNGTVRFDVTNCETAGWFEYTDEISITFPYLMNWSLNNTAASSSIAGRLEIIEDGSTYVLDIYTTNSSEQFLSAGKSYAIRLYNQDGSGINYFHLKVTNTSTGTVLFDGTDLEEVIYTYVASTGDNILIEAITTETPFALLITLDNSTTFKAQLTGALSVNLDVSNVFSNSYDACGGTSVGNKNSVGVYTIGIGGTTMYFPVTGSTGSYTSHNKIQNPVTINGSSVSHNNSITIGGQPVLVLLQQCK
jgi:hypothetical protein